MDEAIKLADRIVIMKAGKIVQVGTPDEILRSPANEFVEDFIGKDRLIQAQQHFQTVDQIMNPNPVTIRPEGTLLEAISLMRSRRVDSLLVTDNDNVLEGFISIEMIDRTKNYDTPVSFIMQTNLSTVKENTLLRDATRNILVRGLKYVPVTDQDNRLIGLVTRASLVDVLYDSIWGEEDIETVVRGEA